MATHGTSASGSQGNLSPGSGGVVAAGWLGPQAVLDHPDRRRIGPALATSLAMHGAVVAALIAALTGVPARILTPVQSSLEFKTVLLPEPGPGGGGGGSPSPAPPKPLEIPEHRTAAAVPVEVAAPVEPPLVLMAPVATNTLALLQASGTSALSLATVGGDGRGKGLGPGNGDGVGPGTDRGFGGGAPQPGNGVTWPEQLRAVRPKYTSDAMRNKIQGVVRLEIVVLADGTVGDVRITSSLDPGLDAAAVEAAKQWRFVPAKRDGKPVAVRVPLELEFRVH